MTKRSFITMILSVIGGLFFALGMCMCLLPEWGAFHAGIVVTIIGAIVLMAMVIYRVKTRNAPFKKPSKKTVQIVALTVAGALILGLGMCMLMVWNMLVPGIIVGVVGMLALLMLIPLVKGVKD